MALTSALRRRRRPIYVALMDLDHFKDFNDLHGHSAGDAPLRRAAIAWRGALRTADVLARYGGEEFAILLASCDIESALRGQARRPQPRAPRSVAGPAPRWTGVHRRPYS